jgi:hypothetical protein
MIKFLLTRQKTIKKEGTSMNTRLSRIIENFTNKVMGRFSQDNILSVEEIEDSLWNDSSDFVRESIAAYAEMIDQLILEQKQERKKARITVHKRNVSREYLSKFGQVEFARTYYKTESGYGYLADKVVGLESYDRISKNVCAELVDRAALMSYQRSTEETTKGKVTKQTVMNQIRKTKGLELIPKGKVKKARFLYVVADEDHVPLQNGKNVIVPLITVHEGIENVSKNRNRCVNAKHFSDYGKPAKVLWEEVGAWLAEEYDVDSIERIYLHGDGAGWIRTGLEFFPRSRFVLDKYHIEKSIKTVTGGSMRGYSFRIRRALQNYDLNKFKDIVDEMLMEVESSSQGQKILRFKKYIMNNWDGIAIRKNDSKCGGSCTEAQVSHVLAERLSRGPKGWSEVGLKYMSKLRVFKVNGERIKAENIKKRNEKVELCEMEKRVVKMVKEVFAEAKNYSIFEKEDFKISKMTPITRMFKGISHTGYAF